MPKHSLAKSQLEHYDTERWDRVFYRDMQAEWLNLFHSRCRACDFSPERLCVALNRAGFRDLTADTVTQWFKGRSVPQNRAQLDALSELIMPEAALARDELLNATVVEKPEGPWATLKEKQQAMAPYQEFHALEMRYEQWCNIEDRFRMAWHLAKLSPPPCIDMSEETPASQVRSVTREVKKDPWRQAQQALRDYASQFPKMLLLQHYAKADISMFATMQDATFEGIRQTMIKEATPLHGMNIQQAQYAMTLMDACRTQAAKHQGEALAKR
ncbi:MAG: hypothetical protein CMM93_05595 [Rickettsiales bacterium]|nr:hypothetical protein [Rickettsiales bacterium]|tara:strand:- start:593 stop:1405 length:813 start_codon:yes stop_codon:yes gene_type:complete